MMPASNVLASGHSVEALARQANMSLSTFHQYFKQITRTSPVQYIKRLRLIKRNSYSPRIRATSIRRPLPSAITACRNSAATINVASACRRCSTAANGRRRMLLKREIPDQERARCFLLSGESATPVWFT